MYCLLQDADDRYCLHHDSVKKARAHCKGSLQGLTGSLRLHRTVAEPASPALCCLGLGLGLGLGLWCVPNPVVVTLCCCAQMYERALAMSPGQPGTLAALGYTHHLMGNLQDAIEVRPVCAGTCM